MKRNTRNPTRRLHGRVGNGQKVVIILDEATVWLASADYAGDLDEPLNRADPGVDEIRPGQRFEIDVESARTLLRHHKGKIIADLQ